MWTKHSNNQNKFGESINKFGRSVQPILFTIDWDSVLEFIALFTTAI